MVFGNNKTKDQTDHVEDAAIPQVNNPYAEKLQTWEDINEGGRKAVENEKSMTVFQAIKTYRKAVFWTFAISLSTIMEGYDESLIGSFFALPAFQHHYGEPYKDGYQMEAKWQSALSMVSPVGVVLGLLLNGFTLEKFGYKKVICTAYIGTIAFVFMTFFAPNKQVLLVGELFCCIMFGMLGGSSLGYASEICPLALRSYSFVNNKSEWSYRIPFALQWVWPLPLLIAAFLAPESPWWLVRNGRLEEAKHSLKRLSSDVPDEDLDNTVSMMVHTDERERELDYGTSYWECFKGTDLRRTEIACFGWACQTLSGFGGPGGSYFFEQVGFSAASSYWFSFIGEIIALAGDATSWALVRYVGRRKLYIGGLSYIFLQWIVIGCLALAPESNRGPVWGQAVLLMLEGYAYDVTIGPLAFTVASETPSTRLRAKTIALARSTFYIISIVNSIISPYEINPTAWNWKGKAAFLSAGCAFISLLWAYFRLPECKNRTFEELDILFERKVPARKFKTAKVDAYQQDDVAVIATGNQDLDTVQAQTMAKAGGPNVV